MSYKDTGIMLCRSENGAIEIDMRYMDETVKLTQAQKKLSGKTGGEK